MADAPSKTSKRTVKANPPDTDDTDNTDDTAADTGETGGDEGKDDTPVVRHEIEEAAALKAEQAKAADPPADPDEFDPARLLPGEVIGAGQSRPPAPYQFSPGDAQAEDQTERNQAYLEEVAAWHEANLAKSGAPAPEQLKDTEKSEKEKSDG